MKRLALILAIVASGHSAKAQKIQLSLDVSAAYQPDNYVYRKDYPTRLLYSVPPLFNFQIGFRKYLKDKPWFYETSLNFAFSQLEREPTFLNNTGPITDLYPVYFTESTFYSGGVNFGVGYEFQNKQQNQFLTVPIGIVTHSIFARKRTTEFENGSYRSTVYFSGALNNWLYFGLYTKPAFEFLPSKKAPSWRLSLFADLRMLFDSSFDHGLIFLYGGGLGVRYDL